MINATVEGDITADLNRVSAKLRAALEEAVEEAAGSVRDTARSLVPRDTGKLHDGIVANAAGLSAKIGVFDPDLYYGAFVEFGTSKQPARPYLTPAAERERGKLKATFTKAIKGRRL